MCNLQKQGEKQNFIAHFYGKDKKKQEIHGKEEVDNILKDIENEKYIITDIKKGQKKEHQRHHLQQRKIMQQEASRKLGFTLKKTMSVAQGLYEGVKVPEKGSVGLITYMRTDSTRISEEARAAAKGYIMNTYGDKYYENRYYYKQNRIHKMLHEGIRPTYIELRTEQNKRFINYRPI